jgi:hypothetical protein
MRRPIAALVVAASLAAVVSLAPGSPAASACAAAGLHHAALVVEHGDGSVVTRCVAFDASQITGEQLLNGSGIVWSGQMFGGFGEAVCAIDGEPARYSSCPGKDSYWAVFVVRSGGAWQLSNAGISTLTLSDGDAEGFRYVPSSGNPVPPPLPGGVCAAGATAGATAGAAATAVAVVPARGTAAPSDAATTKSPASVASVAPADSGIAAVAGAVASATSTASSMTASNPERPARQPGQAPGLDLGLLAAAVAGGGLAGLALLRVFVPRRGAR